MDLALIQQEELLQQYTGGSQVLQPTISATVAAEYDSRKALGFGEGFGLLELPKGGRENQEGVVFSNIVDELEFVMTFAKERKRRLEAQRKGKAEAAGESSGLPSDLVGGSSANLKSNDKQISSESIDDHIKSKAMGNNKQISSEIDDITKAMGNLELNNDDSSSESEYTTDEEFEADFGGKDLARVSADADKALAHAAAMLEAEMAKGLGGN